MNTDATKIPSDVKKQNRDVLTFTVGLAMACLIQICFTVSGFQGVFSKPYLIAIALVFSIRPTKALHYGAFFAIAFFTALLFKVQASDLTETHWLIQGLVIALIAAYCFVLAFIKGKWLGYFRFVPLIALGSVTVILSFKNVITQLSSI
ncbi:MULTISPECIES: hypothetical protein [Vibrio]|uniref:hypothetical protein n=1 Tax=Vibrio TaxID=662 RepID=UPI000841E80B|nr:MULTISPECIES: hypothetical protein [Vibrio]ODM56898.1 hypothetical protein BC455_18740 [Vibrio harveyi]USD58465.1 hypothetical protein J4N44_27615 [Vibrio sp. SCSIO 43155]